MTRQTKIIFFVCCLVVGIIAMRMLPGEDQEEVTISYAGISTNDSNLVVFAISNTCRSSFEYFVELQEERNQNWAPASTMLQVPFGTLPCLVTNELLTTRFPTNRWRIIIGYAHSFTPSLVEQFENKLAWFAFRHNWDDLGQRLSHPMHYETAISPMMLGNKPVEPVPK